MNSLDYLIIEIVVLFFLSKKILTRASGRLNMYFLAILFLPGTTVHEFAHYLTAKLLFVPTKFPNLLPRKTEKGIILGSVLIAQTNPLKKTLIGIAPLIIGAMIIILVPQNTILAIFVIFEIGNTMFMSKEDLEGTKTVLVIFVLTYLGLKLAGANLNLLILPKPLSFYFIAPIVIDLIVITLIRLIRLVSHP